ncbi:LysE family translocator [Nonomuraea thailandensis]
MYLLAFIGACVLVAMVPGVSTAIILRQTLRAGRGSGLAATLGNETGILLWGLAAAFGLSALLVASQVAYDIMRVTGAALLVVMGAQALWHARRARRPRPRARSCPAGAGRTWPEWAPAWPTPRRRCSRCRSCRSSSPPGRTCR